MYTLAIHLYAFLVEAASVFHKKARMMRFGQWKTNGILRDRIAAGDRYIWFHAASLGEFEQGRPLIEKIRAAHPEYKILLTFFSPSGYEVRKNYPGADVVCYLPFDTPYRVRKFLHLAHPAMAIFIKYEFWGNYLRELQRRQVPTYIISAVFRREQAFFRWYGKPYLRMLRCFDHLFVQDRPSADLLAAQGITNTTVTGDTRFDRVIDVQQQARLLPMVEQFIRGAEGGEKPFVLVAGSTWPPDEEFIIACFNAHPRMKLIIAPHEIDQGRLLDIHSRLKRPSVRLSDTNENHVASKDCLIIDSFGLLSSIYRYGDAAYVGGGFGKGIHNTLEAAVYGIPVLFGPRYGKFREAADLIASGGGFSVANGEAFDARMDVLLSSADALHAAGEAAGRFVSRNAGATDRILAWLSAHQKRP